ncbi:MAG TPA: membrane protein insertase YidC, partial [Aestuariivirga sp.]|nr:membrane protein insertase YidC [Aestuariivirga sp.]
AVVVTIDGVPSQFAEAVACALPEVQSGGPSTQSGVAGAQELPRTGASTHLDTMAAMAAALVLCGAAGTVLGLDKPVTLTWDNGQGLLFARTIGLGEDYVFTVTQTVRNNTAQPVSVIPYARSQRQDTPYTQGYYVFFEGMLGVQDGELTELTYKDIGKKTEAQRTSATGGWLGFTDKYWATALIPDPKTRNVATYQHLNQGGRDIYQADYIASAPLTVGPGTEASYQDMVYAGAKEVNTIAAVGDRHGLDKFDLMIDWGWFGFLTKPMYRLLHLVNQLVGNFGIAILIVTVLVKLAVFPLANKSYASMSKMKKLQPEMTRLKELYPEDKMKQQQEMMEIYKREKVSPLSGCLPIFVQIPVFFALYKVILTSIDLRHAPFFGWINDLSAPDPTSLFNLFGLIPWHPPAMLMIGIWPLLMGITMWVQMRLNPTPPDPIQASLFNWMPVIFTFTLGSFPAGLVIYWAWSNLLSILQQSYIMKKHGTEVDILGNIRESIPFLKKNKTEAS